MAIANVLSFAAAAVLVLAALPFARLRRLVLVLLTHALRVVLFGAAAGCAVLAVSPALAPDELTSSAAHVLAVARLPLSPKHGTVFWLGLGGLLLLAGLPLAAHLEYARKAAAVTALFDALERHASAAVRAVRQSTGQTSEIATGPAYPDGDVAAGVAVLRAVLNDTDRRPPAATRPTLVKDVLLAQSRQR
jgi:hypothetical protein